MPVSSKAYRIAASVDDAHGFYETEEELKVLDDFLIESRYLDRYHDAILNNDREEFDKLIANQAVYVAERLGKKEDHRKPDVMAHFGEKAVMKVRHHTRHDVKFYTFGGNTVVMTGISTSAFNYKGLTSNGPRIFAITYMKLDGRWQCAVHAIMDYDGTDL
jgi:hypothetical protein